MAFGTILQRSFHSVEPDNDARSLYRRAGFERVGLDHGAWTMLLTLSGRRA